jgi:predicted ATPase
MENNQSGKKFKFCYVMRGAPGSGKTTVANELARNTGVIITLDMSQGSSPTSLA